MWAMASQITSLTIVYSTVYSGADQRKYQSYASLAFSEENSPVTGEFPAQRASNAENAPFDDVIMFFHECSSTVRADALLGNIVSIPTQFRGW